MRRNEYNVTGLCNRSSCPLANSLYATIREEEGKCFLCIKTPERSHMPKKWWERIELSSNYGEALKEIDQHLKFWPKFLVHKNKQRLTKITQYLLRMRRLETKVRPKLVTMPARKEKQLRRKEAKAEAAAKLEKSIEAELVARLQKGTYNDIYNFPTKAFQNNLVDAEAQEEELEEELDYDEDDMIEEFVERSYDSEEDSEGDYSDDANTQGTDEEDTDDGGGADVVDAKGKRVARDGPSSFRKKRGRISVEYEMETAANRTMH
eukprot:scaffold80_cov325-Pavlova_lutheri.AAC.19